MNEIKKKHKTKIIKKIKKDTIEQIKKEKPEVIIIEEIETQKEEEIMNIEIYKNEINTSIIGFINSENKSLIGKFKKVFERVINMSIFGVDQKIDFLKNNLMFDDIELIQFISNYSNGIYIFFK
jgi:hypothetical protein